MSKKLPWNWSNRQSLFSWPSFDDATQPQMGWRQAWNEAWSGPRSLARTDADDATDEPSDPATTSGLEIAALSASSVIALVGLAFEAKIAAGPGVLVICRGGERCAADVLPMAVENGCHSIISFGVGGGLVPDLIPGDCVVASSVIDYPSLLPTDPMWSSKLLAMIPEARHGPIVGVNAVVTNPDDKRSLQAMTGAVAVDMESHLVARLALSHGLSFASVRVIIDPADRIVPPAALLAMTSAGTTDVSSMLWEILARPSQLTALMRLAADAYVARTALLRLRRAVGPDFRCG